MLKCERRRWGMARELSKREKKDIKVLAKFVEVFCRATHEAEKTVFTVKAPPLRGLWKRPVLLCPDCARLLAYGLAMRLSCPNDPKPLCKNCPNPCYRPDYRGRIREVMKFAGLYLIKRGRIDLLYHYFR
jgi:hypothetical protein